MKKGLKITNEVYVNLDNLCVWINNKNSMQLQMACSDDLAIVDIIIEGSKDDQHNSGHRVEINEFKRIQREISEYLNI